MKVRFALLFLLSLCCSNLQSQIFNKVERSTYFGEWNDGDPGDSIQVLISGKANLGANNGSAEGTYKLKIEGYQNDDGIVYPIHISDENELLDFYIRNRQSGSGIPRMFFAGDVFMGDEETSDSKLRWVNNKASFQAGRATSDQWDNAGTYSFIAGNNNSADGFSAAVVGQNNQSGGSASFSGGLLNSVTAQSAFAYGEGNLASGFSSAAFGCANEVGGRFAFSAGGKELIAKSYGEVVLGRFNDTLSINSEDSWGADDILFAAGYGSSNSARNNAFTIMKNGEVHFHKQDRKFDAILLAHRDGPKHGGDGTFDFGNDKGFVLEHKDATSAAESSGIYGDGSSIHLWSPGDESRILSVHDEDDMDDGTSEKWYIDNAGIPSSLVEDPDQLHAGSLFGAVDKVKMLRSLSYALPEETKEGEIANAARKQLHIDPNTLEQVLPELVDTKENGQQYIKYHGVIVLLTEAVKEQQIVIEDLTVQNDRLLKRLDEIEKKLEGL